MRIKVLELWVDFGSCLRALIANMKVLYVCLVCQVDVIFMGLLDIMGLCLCLLFV